MNPDRRTTIRRIAGLAALLALTSCSERITGATTPNVQVQDDSYSPAATTVGVGTTVHFTWTGMNPHTVTFDDGPASAVQTTGTYDRLFTVAGVYPYECAVHGASMSGTITVQ